MADMEFRKIYDFRTTLYSGVFGVAFQIENRWVSKILYPPFWIPKIRCQIHNQRPQKLLSTEFWRNRVVSKIVCPTHWISAILRRVWLFEISETSFFLQFNYSDDRWSYLGSSPNILLAWRKLWNKKIPDFLVLFYKFGAILDFLPDQTQFWPRILEEHSQNYKETWFSFEISIFQSWEWGLNIS